MLYPNDHLRMLIELLRPAGPEIARRWLAALLIVPEEDREAVVQAIEARIIEVYEADQPTPAPEATAATPRRQASA